MRSKTPTALTIGFDFVNGMLRACKGNCALFGALMAAMFRYGETGKEPEFAENSVCAVLWPMAKVKVNQTLYQYYSRVRKNEVGGKKTQLKSKLRALGASEEQIEAFFTGDDWNLYETEGIEPECGWELQTFLMEHGG